MLDSIWIPFRFCYLDVMIWIWWPRAASNNLQISWLIFFRFHLDFAFWILLFGCDGRVQHLIIFRFHAWFYYLNFIILIWWLGAASNNLQISCLIFCYNIYLLDFTILILLFGFDGRVQHLIIFRFHAWFYLDFIWILLFGFYYLDLMAGCSI